jgi:hypothetical protein
MNLDPRGLECKWVRLASNRYRTNVTGMSGHNFEFQRLAAKVWEGKKEKPYCRPITIIIKISVEHAKVLKGRRSPL